MKNQTTTSRRQWLTGLLRGGVLAAFGTAAFHLLRGEKGLEESACGDPKGHIGCRSCGQLNGCRLPRALSIKQFLKNEQTHEKPRT